MNNLKTVESVVFEILKENKAARNDDMKLYLLVCEKMNPLPCHRKIGSFAFAIVMTHYKELNLPHFESVRRARARIQSNCPEVAGEPRCRKNRKKLQSVYRKYAKS